jgi:hypothetical protein
MLYYEDPNISCTYANMKDLIETMPAIQIEFTLSRGVETVSSRAGPVGLRTRSVDVVALQADFPYLACRSRILVEFLDNSEYGSNTGG